MTLSVLIANYNQSHVLEESLGYLFAQTRQPDEIIIIDDASTQNDVEIIKRLCADKKNVFLYQNERNRGVVWTINKAISLATKDYLHLPSDNIYKPDFYEKYLNVLAQYPKAAIAFGDAGLYQDGTWTFRELGLPARYFSPQEMAALGKKSFFAGNQVHSTLIRRDLMMIREELKWYCDFFLVNCLAYRYGGCYVPGRLSAFRITQDAFSRKATYTMRKQVYQTLLSLLRSEECADIRPLLRESVMLRCFLPKIIPTLLTSPRDWDLLSQDLIKATIRSISPKVLVNIAHLFQQRKLA